MAAIANNYKSEYFRTFLKRFNLSEQPCLFANDDRGNTSVEVYRVNDCEIPLYKNEFWTSKQRQASSIHEISYRACFKPQLPHFFIENLTEPGDIIYDPFGGRGTTAIEAGLLSRKALSNDINPLSRILAQPRYFVPTLDEITQRLREIPILPDSHADIDLSMFYHPATEAEIVSLRNYLILKRDAGTEDELDMWIRMVATNRLTGHSAGFFSVYTLPPNQAVTPEQQIKINNKRSQVPEYRDTKKLIIRKTRSLISNLSETEKQALRQCGKSAVFLAEQSQHTPTIQDNTVALTVTSPPFLDVVQYAADNWLRSWFNNIDAEAVSQKITIARNVETWYAFIKDVFQELYRITKPGGWVAFEVGEVRGGRIKLEDYVVPAGMKAGFNCEAILINEQTFTKTANIWGVSNNTKGTNSNRVVLFSK